MMFKKAQADPKELVMTLVIAGILFIVGVLIFANVTNSTNSILDADVSRQSNETINITQIDASDNSTLLTQSRFVLNSESARNATNASEVLVRNTDYNISLSGPSGGVGTRANFTLLGLGEGTGGAYNITEIKISYSFNSESPAQATNTIIQSTVLDSFSLGVIALIVLAAVVILAVLFKLGTS